MRTDFLFGVVATVGLVLTACGGKNDSQSTASGADDVGTTQGGGTDTESGAESSGADPGESSGGTDASTGAGTGGVTAGFIQEPDGGGTNAQCNLWEPDCPDGEKCMPWANDGGSAWNATRCSPLDPDPAEVGDACTVQGSGVSGVDDCADGSMCWAVDPETNVGTCAAFCGGSEANPVCENPATNCVITNEGVLILCLPNCNPILPGTCPEGQACYPVDDGFACAPDASGELGAYGDACEFINVCDPGLFCAGQDAVPGCTSLGCCSPFCDVSDPDASASCPGAAGGQQCEEWYEVGQAPPDLGDVGACVIPA